MSGFFDQFDRFYETSITSPLPDRLNARHTAIIEANAELLSGARVLDIASHDGRWSFAALSAGAAHVTGIEPRADLVEHANANCAAFDIDRDRYTFMCGDVFDVLIEQSFDVVLCLGFYYHTIRHAELLDRIERTGASLIIIDTEVTPRSAGVPETASLDDSSRLVFDNAYSIELMRDPVDAQEMAVADSLTRNGHTLVGRPSRAAVAYMAAHFGFSCTMYDWARFFDQHPTYAASMVDYAEGWRDTFTLIRLP